MVIQKILLVSPNCLREPYPVYPLALSYLKSYLDRYIDQIQVELFDFNIEDQEHFETKLRQFQPDMIGLSLRNIDTVNMLDDRHFVQGAKDLVLKIRNNLNTIIVLGGAGFSIFPETIFDLVNPDYAILGEGEESLLDLINALRGQLDVSGIEGLIYHKNSSVVINQRTHYCKDPEPEYDDKLIDYYWESSGMINLQTKRGCSYECAYCTYPLIDGNTIRVADPAKIVKWLKYLRRSKGITYFFFTDSVFNVRNDYNQDLAKAIIKEDLDIQWGAYFTPHNLHSDLLQLLKKSGLTHVEFGTESLSNSTLKAYNKRFSVEEILETSESCTKMGLHTAHFLILGGLGETEASIAETIQNSGQIEKAVFFPYLGMRIYPKTRLYYQAADEGKIEPDSVNLEPTYYLADGIDYKSIKKRTKLTRNRWIFPDDNLQKPMEMMRKKGAKGPLWEMLIKS